MDVLVEKGPLDDPDSPESVLYNDAMVELLSPVCSWAGDLVRSWMRVVTRAGPLNLLCHSEKKDLKYAGGQDKIIKYLTQYYRSLVAK